MGLSRLQAASGQVITTVDAKLRCRIDDASEDSVVDQLIKAATAMIEKQTGRALLQQQWLYTLPAFVSSTIRIPLPPLSSVNSVKYRDKAGVLQTVNASDYIVDKTSLLGTVTIADGKSWPPTQVRPDAVQIDFVCGYGAAANIDDDLLLAVYLLIGHFYANREAVSDRQMSELPLGVQAIISNYWVPVSP